MEQDAVLRISHSDEGYGIIARKRVRAITGSREPTIEDYHAALVQCLKDKAAEIERLRPTDAEADGCGLVAAMIQTGEDGGVFGIRIQERDDFPPKKLIPLYLSPQLTLTPAERRAVEATIVDLDGGANFNEQRVWPSLAKRLHERSNTLRGLLERTCASDGTNR